MTEEQYTRRLGLGLLVLGMFSAILFQLTAGLLGNFPVNPMWALSLPELLLFGMVEMTSEATVADMMSGLGIITAINGAALLHISRIEHRQESEPKDELEQLRERFASGELTEEEFEKRVEQLLAEEQSTRQDEKVKEGDRDAQTREQQRT